MLFCQNLWTDYFWVNQSICSPDRSGKSDRSLGGDVRQDAPHGKLFCLACMHARTHARTHTQQSTVGLGLSNSPVRLSVVVRFSGFTCFRSVFGSACEYAMFFWGMSWGFRLVGRFGKHGVAIRTRFHEEFECLCFLCQLNCNFTRGSAGFSSWQLF